MKCKECEAQGEVSRVYPGQATVTAMYCAPFYDEEGRLHSHDSNIHTTSYHCNKGHKWTVKSKGKCWCGWPDNP